SLDDMEGDVVAGICAVTLREALLIDMLWVGEPLRGKGIGRRFLQMIEEEAAKRGAVRARVRVLTSSVAFFVGAGYRIAGTVQTLPFKANTTGSPVTSATSVHWLEKDF